MSRRFKETRHIVVASLAVFPFLVLTPAVGELAAALVPPALAAVTVTTIRYPTSAFASAYVEPPLPVEAHTVPALSQRLHA